jgi:uncharacterized protein (UPF0303 family)
VTDDQQGLIAHLEAQEQELVADNDVWIERKLIAVSRYRRRRRDRNRSGFRFPKSEDHAFVPKMFCAFLAAHAQT